jgi:hypothetical protein
LLRDDGLTQRGKGLPAEITQHRGVTPHVRASWLLAAGVGRSPAPEAFRL